MRQHFPWYFPLKNDDMDNIWDNALLTLDANVLLDLYRVNLKTRDTLINAIESFSGRLWLSYQAGYEYIKNINKVKNDSEATVLSIGKDIDDNKKKFFEFINLINSKKILDKDTVSKFEKEVSAIFEKIKEHSDQIKSKHLKDLKSDFVLEWVTKTFDNSVGSEIPNNKLQEWEKEAKTRIENKIPPGYMDKSKDCNSYGDIFVWKQVLEKAKEISKPIIFITSEQKEDWWEKYSGKIVGQRFELLKEAYNVSGQKIIIWRTEHFLETYGKRKGKGKIDAKTADAIQELTALRSNSCTAMFEQENVVNDELDNLGYVYLDLFQRVDSIPIFINFEPPLKEVPNVKIRKVNTRTNKILDIVITQTNISKTRCRALIARENGDSLPPIKYKFEYIASCNKSDTCKDTSINHCAIEPEETSRIIKLE